MGFGSVSNINILLPPSAIVLEDNVFSFYGVNVGFIGRGKHENIVVRRNQILNSYSTSGHSQGISAGKVNIIFEENLLDHNGWYKKSYVKLNSTLEGQATYFNHNAYFSDIYNSVIVNNISSRASSIAMKFASNSETETANNSIKSYDLMVDNNLVIDSEVGLSLGGNIDFNNGYRWKNINILNNVFLNIGHSQPTNRVLAWSIEANDWDGGVIFGNYILFNDNPDVTNVKGIIVKGLSKNITVDSNVIYKTNAEEGMKIYLENKEGLDGVSILRNYIDYIYDNNQGGNNIEAYMALQGEEASIDAFLIKVKGLSKGNWNKVYTTKKVNAYLKEQFN